MWKRRDAAEIARIYLPLRLARGSGNRRLRKPEVYMSGKAQTKGRRRIGAIRGLTKLKLPDLELRDACSDKRRVRVVNALSELDSSDRRKLESLWRAGSSIVRHPHFRLRC